MLVKQNLKPYKEEYDVLGAYHGHRAVKLLGELVGWFVLEAQQVVSWRFIDVEDITALDLNE